MHVNIMNTCFAKSFEIVPFTPQNVHNCTSQSQCKKYKETRFNMIIVIISEIKIRVTFHI